MAKVPHGHWKTATLIAASLDHAGMRCSATIDGSVNQNAFEAFIEQVLLPVLAVQGDLVVMDNLSSHKGVRIRTLIESVGAQRWCTCRRTVRI